jgi:hypothetical protein
VDARRIDLTPRPLGRPGFGSLIKSVRRSAVAPAALAALALILSSGALWLRAGGASPNAAVSSAFRTAVHQAVPLATDGTAPVALPAPPPPPPPPAPAPAPVAAPDVDASSAAAWAASPGVACIREHESGDNYSEDTGNGYYGAYQDLLSTWEAHGGTGLPSDAPPAVQDQINYEIYLTGGWGQWSTAAMCGL